MNTTQATVAMIDALEAVGIPYMLVGSLSSNVYGIVHGWCDSHGTRDLLDEIRNSIPTIDGY